MDLSDLRGIRRRAPRRKTANRAAKPIARMTDAEIMALSDDELLRRADPATRRLLRVAWRLKGAF